MIDKIRVQNLKCGGCAKSISKKLNDIHGLNQLHVDVNNSEISFVREKIVELETVKEFLSQLGYPAISDQNSIGKKAKSFVSCAVGRMS